MSSHTIRRRFVIIGVLLFVLSGCSMYQNLTGYFNTYYNAKKIFDDAEEEINVQRQAARDTNYFAHYASTKSTNDKLDKVIEKCSKLLESYSQSKWVDDALLMIGKSYVYKDESESALRKFQELLDNFPNSDLRFEDKLWYAEAEYYSHKEDDALKKINDLIPEAQTNEQHNIVVQAFMLQGQIFVERNEYLQAAESYERAANVQGDGYLRAIARYQCGQNYERLGDYPKAAAAYNKVMEDNPDADLGFRGRLHYGKMLALTKQPEKALEVFAGLKEDQPKPEVMALVELEIGNTYIIMDDTAKAFAVYTLIDTTYRKTDAAAKSNYQRGVMYEKQFLNFSKAREYYDRAKDEFPPSSITPLAQKKSTDFARYFKYYSDLTDYDTLLYLALHPDTAHLKGDTTSSRWDSSTARSVAHLRSDTLSGKIDSVALAQKPIVRDSVRRSIEPPDVANSEFDPVDKGELFDPRRRGRHRSEGREEEDSVALHQRFRGPRVDSLTAAADSSSRKLKVRQRRSAIVLSPDSLRSKIMRTQFELAGLFLLEFEQPDSALQWYERVANESFDSSLIPRVLYALAEIYRSKKDSTMVESLYKRILTQYDNSAYAIEVRKLLGMQVAVTKVDSAELKYQGAAVLLQEGKPLPALKELRSIAKKYPMSPFAPKAEYTSGWIYENILFNNDSAASWYRRLLKDYPTSVYASSVGPKLAIKDNPENLQQYVKVKEIQLVGKESDAQEESKGLNPRNSGQRQGEQIQKGRGRDRVEDDEDNSDDEDNQDEDVPDPDDDNN